MPTSDGNARTGRNQIRKKSNFHRKTNRPGAPAQKIYSCDLETNNHEDDCRVWAAVAYEIRSEKTFLFQTLDEFMHFMETHNGKYYFHNLKFDGGFIIDWLLNHGFEHTFEKDSLPHQFSTLISDMNVFYQIGINFNGKVRKIIDSYKVLPFGVEQLPKLYGLKEQKGEIDYNEIREPGHTLTEEERAYITTDAVIVGKCLLHLLDEGMTRMTQGSNALHNYKQMKGDRFKTLFPTVTDDRLMRPAYRGGYTFANPAHILEDIGEGVVYDKNSMYPWVMRNLPLPFGKPEMFMGRPCPNKSYNLYVYSFMCAFEIKPGYLPTLQDKSGAFGFMPTEYLYSSNGQTMPLCLTNVDYELFLEHYNIIEEIPIGGWMFQSSSTLFADYIDHWYGVKEQASRDGNDPMRQLAKLMLNALYGKFGTRTEQGSKYPVLMDGVVKYKLGPIEHTDGLYLPIAIFVTSWARNDIIRLGQKNINRLLYIDTDSLHLMGREVPEGMEIDPYKLGAWKEECTFRRARYIRAKRYVEEVWNEKNGEWKLDIKCCGLPRKCHEQVTWENFKPGTIYTGKLQHKTVKGGVYLRTTTFELCS